MADHHSSKRLETTPGASGRDKDDARVEKIIVSLESENRALHQQLLRSDAENARLRKQLEFIVGHH